MVTEHKPEVVEKRRKALRQGNVAIAAALALGLAAGCTSRPATSSWSAVDSAGIRIVTSAEPSADWQLSRSPLLSLGDVDGSGPTLFFRVRGVELLDGERVAVVNGGSESVRVFDRDGHLRVEFGRPGHGPDEFTGLYVLGERADSFVTYDGGNDRVSVRSATGALERTFRLEWFSGLLTPEYLGDSSMLAMTVRSMVDLEGTGEIVDSVLVSRYDYRGRLLDSIGRIPGNVRVVATSGIYRTTVGEPYTANASIVPSAAGFCYVFGPAAEVRCLDGRGRLVEIARVDLPAQPVTQADVDAYWAVVESSKPGPRREAQLRFRKNMPFPAAFPAFDRLRLDDDGRMWARQYEHAADQPHAWWVFEQGRAVARLRTPAGFELHDVEGRRVAGVRTDQLGLEHVEVYALSTVEDEPYVRPGGHVD